MNDYFELSLNEGVAHLVLNRPERLNTMAPPFFPLLRDAVRKLADEGAARVLVISSTGKHFSAGMALDVFDGNEAMLLTGSARARLNFQESLRRLIDCFSALDEVRFPVICAIQGGCIGGALDLATACDIRVCSSRRVLHRAGDPHRHDGRPRRVAAPAEDRAAGAWRAKWPTRATA